MYGYEEERKYARDREWEKEWEKDHYKERDKDREKERDKKKRDNFKDLVKEAIADELSAVALYSEMANIVKNPVLKALIFSIAGDEYSHARTWMSILELDY